MEVCGGVGYIEEWSDLWLVCDVYLGLIWEGISNIVVLDVVCVVSCEQVFEFLQCYLCWLLDDSDLLGDVCDFFDELLV